MADTITFLPKDDAGEQILDEFEQKTELEAATGDDENARVYSLAGAGHQIEIVETLNEIDPEWSQHLALQMPA